MWLIVWLLIGFVVTTYDVITEDRDGAPVDVIDVQVYVAGIILGPITGIVIFVGVLVPVMSKVVDSLVALVIEWLEYIIPKE